MKKQQGFTLIELMIAVAIIGILAAVAIPQYQSYVGRSNVAAAVATVSATKTPIEDFIMRYGAFPDGTTAAEAAVGNPGDNNYKPAVIGEKLEDLGLSQPTFGEMVLSEDTSNPGAGSITVTFNSGNPGVNGRKVQFARDKEGTWACKSSADQEYVDKSCAHVASL
ncbi:pilin [Endozoicomonas sp.]|uniref:pilin n=1 Tax=Endozoicomonas sp. TaxID=1892382 RepID=UPI003AF91397